jgi:hypothetical protein
VIQFAFGEDAFDASYMEFEKYDPYGMTQEKYWKTYIWPNDSIDGDKWLKAEQVAIL